MKRASRVTRKTKKSVVERVIYKDGIKEMKRKYTGDKQNVYKKREEKRKTLRREEESE